MSFCEAVFDNWCTAPPSDERDAPKTRAECFACGLPACPSCSTKIKWHHYGKRRICTNCLSQHDMNDQLAQLAWTHAGYEGDPSAWVLAMLGVLK